MGHRNKAVWIWAKLHHSQISFWLVVLTILKHICQWEGWHTIKYEMENKINVPNHQPGLMVADPRLSKCSLKQHGVLSCRCSQSIPNLWLWNWDHHSDAVTLCSCTHYWMIGILIYSEIQPIKHINSAWPSLDCNNKISLWRIYIYMYMYTYIYASAEIPIIFPKKTILYRTFFFRMFWRKWAISHL